MKKLSIVSFNMRLPAEMDGENYFFNRLPLIKKTVEARKPDLIGLQEVTDASRDALAKALPDYTLVGTGRNPDRHGEGVAFLYRKDTLELCEMSCRWLSSKPFTPGTRYEDSDQSPCPRFMLTALFVPKDASVSPFRVYNLHTDHVGAEARLLASRDLLAAIESDNTLSPLPCVALGDFNATPDSPEMLCLTAEGSPLRDVSDKLQITFHRWHEKGYAGVKIDYILVSKEFKHEKTVLWTEAEGNLCLSDHYPVEATLLL